FGLHDTATNVERLCVAYDELRDKARNMASAEAYANMRERAENAERELKEKTTDYERACQTIALMHDAATEKGQGPIRGVVEDIEDLRKERDQLRGELARQSAPRPLPESPAPFETWE